MGRGLNVFSPIGPSLNEFSPDRHSPRDACSRFVPDLSLCHAPSGVDGLTPLHLDIAAFTAGVAECPDSFTSFRADSPPGGDPLRKKKAQTHPWAAKKQGTRSEAETPRRTNQSRCLAILVAFDTTAISAAMVMRA